jgi:hypothetical protein
MPKTIEIALHTGKKLYFASDFHLGAPDLAASHVREKRIVKWLDHIKTDAQVIFLVGDLFDFWHEYRTVVPRGYVRLLGKLAELNDSGIEIVVFTGNHDMWMSDYFETELGVKVIREPMKLVIGQNDDVVSHISNIQRPTSNVKYRTSHLFTLLTAMGWGRAIGVLRFSKKYFKIKLSVGLFGLCYTPTWHFRWAICGQGIAGANTPKRAYRRFLVKTKNGSCSMPKALKHRATTIFIFLVIGIFCSITPLPQTQK